jgi:Methyltransferase FkbM domain
MPAPPPVIEVQTQVGPLLAHRDDEVITANLIRWGVWEARETEFVRALLRPGDTFVDVGANEANRGDHRLAPHDGTGLRVRCVRLDDVLPRSVDVIKIDTQGFDHDVVAGLTKTIAANPALVVLTELSLTKLGDRGIDVDEVVAGYLARGFGIEALDPSGTPYPLAAADVLPHCVATAPEEISLVLRRTR